ncbi:hypothetical protein D3C86_1835610 [compost metagenome]
MTGNNYSFPGVFFPDLAGQLLYIVVINKLNAFGFNQGGQCLAGSFIRCAKGFMEFNAAKVANQFLCPFLPFGR